MPEISATEAARHFSDLLDAIEHEGASYTILRHGKAVAQIEPTRKGLWGDVRLLLDEHPPDPRWVEDIRSVRELLEPQPRW
jgi:antitoxin (DNA-binding transcriptional repressor) of toxin-antitoxin stability system